MALFFSPQGFGILDPQQWVEHLGTAIPLQVPSNYVLNAFEAPGPEHMLRLPDGSDAGYAVARLVVYGDQNQDGRHTPGEPFLGIAPPVGFYYVPESLPAGRTPTNGALAAGFSKVLLPQPCGYQPPPPTDPNTCGVPLGDHCDVDADCLGGLCLKETKIVWPAGYCTIPDPPPSACRPTAAVYMRRPKNSLTPPVAKNGLYLRPCMVDADCARALDRDPGLYICDPGLLACVPGVGNTMVPVGGRFDLEPFCAM